jgi:hypothetical protein
MAGPGLGHKLHGKNGAIYFGGPVSGGGTKVTTKTEWTLNLNRDYVDATVFGDTNKTYLVGLRDIQGTFAGLLDTSGDYQVAATLSDAVNIYLYGDDGTNGGTVLLIASGPGLIDAAITASNTDAIKTTGNFRASGAWTVFTTGI